MFSFGVDRHARRGCRRHGSSLVVNGRVFRPRFRGNSIWFRHWRPTILGSDLVDVLLSEYQKPLHRSYGFPEMFIKLACSFGILISRGPGCGNIRCPNTWEWPSRSKNEGGGTAKSDGLSK